jgi:hypothetical protein
MNDACTNSVASKGTGGARCSDCKWSPEADDTTTGDCWRPLDKRTRFPRREEEEREAAYQKRKAKLQERAEQRQNKDKRRIRINRAAAQAERATNRAIIHATVNSGRLHNDGDHISAGSIVLDTKLQSTREHPVIKLDELAKVRVQAKRAGYPIGALVLRNKFNQGFVVMAEEDYARLTHSRINHEQQQTSES